MNNLENNNVLAVIVEYNPMHNGHIYHIKKAKDIVKPKYTIGIMSGDFTQQGNISGIDKFTKSKLACELGLDLVIELPTIYAISSCENFAYGSIKILSSLNCVTHICFGSECEDIALLESIAKKTIENEDKIISQTKTALKSGFNVAVSRDQALKKFLTSNEYCQISSSNNILAIEYIRSLLKYNSNIKPICIKRILSKHSDADTLGSSSSIRNALQCGTIDKIEHFVPQQIFNVITSQSFLTNDSMWKNVSYIIIKENVEGLLKIYDMDLGLATRMYTYAQFCNSYDEFINNVKCKNYTLGRIKRAVIYCLLGITKDIYTIANTSCYANVLAIKYGKKAVLLSLLSKASIPILTSINDKVLSKLDEPNYQSFKIDILATHIYNSLSSHSKTTDYTNKI